MNEQIKTLIEQADIKFEAHPQHQGINTAVIIQSDLEKFAELIVGQCMIIGFNTVYELEDDSKAVAVYKNIQKHFGVEE